MKKTLVAIAALAASVGAMAQSSVTLFGGGDVNLRSASSGSNKFTGIGQDGIYSSRFGVLGTEDMGGGLKGNFHFEGGMNPDTGTPGGFNFTRKSVLGLAGGFGEVRIGRDYTPMFTVHGFDPFGTNGVGSAGNMMFSTVVNAAVPTGTFSTALAASTGPAQVNAAGVTVADTSNVRANNSIAYYTPNFSGFSAGLMYGFGVENQTSAARNAAKVFSAKLGYDNGPLSAALGLQNTKAAAAGDKWDTTLLGASYNFGIAKAHFLHKQDKVTIGTSAKIKDTLLGVSAPLGATTLKATYITKKAGSTKAGTQLALGAVYDLSKRSNLYGTYSKLSNKPGFANSVGVTPSDFSGLASKGFEVGFKHSF